MPTWLWILDISLIVISAPIWGGLLFILARMFCLTLLLVWIQIYCSLTDRPVPKFITDYERETR